MSKKFSLDKRISSYLVSEPEFRVKYEKIRKLVTGIYSSGYDISNRCNLVCEGCLYFDGDGLENYPDNKELYEWDMFFKQEVERGVNFPFISGAEPSLHQDRLAVANKYWKHGIVFTNGIIPLSKELTFSIHISIWGDEETDKTLRGANILQKVFDNYKDDDRVVYIITITHQTVNQLEDIANLVLKNNGRLTFNHYSPTEKYNERLIAKSENNKKFFRISNVEDNLLLTSDDLMKSRSIVDGLIDKHGDRVVCSHYYNQWITNPSGIYDIDQETGIATDCSTRNASFHKYFRIDQTEDESEKKCCVPFFDCNTCRGYAFSHPTLVSRMRRHLKNKNDFLGWVDSFDKWCELSFVGWSRLPVDEHDKESFWQ